MRELSPPVTSYVAPLSMAAASEARKTTIGATASVLCRYEIEESHAGLAAFRVGGGKFASLVSRAAIPVAREQRNAGNDDYESNTSAKH